MLYHHVLVRTGMYHFARSCPGVQDSRCCPLAFRKKCDCLFAISVKTYPDKVMLFVSGEHTADSHKGGLGLLTVKQQHAIRTAVRCAPLQSGGAVHANLKNFSPGRQVPTNRRSMEAVARMVRKERKAIMAARVP